MTTIRFGPEDLAKVRFAISPLFELWQSVRALQDPRARTLHLPWLVESQQRLRDLDLSLLYALQPPYGISPDFIHPPPIGPAAELEDELEQLLETPDERVRAELSQTYQSEAPPPILSRLITDPEGGLTALVELLRAYWQSSLAPHWERIRAVLERDILYRARQTARRGAQALFSDLNETVCYADAQIVIKWGCPELDRLCTEPIDLEGQGLLLVPSVFIPFVALIHDAPWQPTIIYAARGVGLVWEPAPSAPDALRALIGRRRAAVLALLDVPRSTTELARQLQVPPGSVSQHLAVLRSVGLVNRHRVGRVVLYERSATGNLLAGGQTEVTGPAAA